MCAYLFYENIWCFIRSAAASFLCFVWVCNRMLCVQRAGVFFICGAFVWIWEAWALMDTAWYIGNKEIKAFVADLSGSAFEAPSIAEFLMTAPRRLVCHSLSGVTNWILFLADSSGEDKLHEWKRWRLTFRVVQFVLLRGWLGLFQRRELECDFREWVPWWMAFFLDAHAAEDLRQAPRLCQCNLWEPITSSLASLCVGLDLVLTATGMM